MFWDTTEECVKGFAYATEPKRLLQVVEDQAIFEGRHVMHTLARVNGGTWTCDCAAYRLRSSYISSSSGWCRHVIALERILDTLTDSASPVMFCAGAAH